MIKMKFIFSFFTSKPQRTLVIAILWTVLILVACFIPGNEVPKVKIFQFDKLVHIALFAGGSCLWTLGLYKHERKQIAIRMWILFFCVVLGVLVELLQSSSWVQGRSGDVWDAVADTIGVIAGIYFANFLLRFSYSKNEQQMD